MTALVANKSDAGYLILKEAYRQKIAIPDCVSVVSANQHAYSEFLFPALMTVHLPAVQLGSETVKILLRSLAQKNYPYVNISLSCTVTEREAVREIKSLWKNMNHYASKDIEKCRNNFDVLVRRSFAGTKQTFYGMRDLTEAFFTYSVGLHNFFRYVYSKIKPHKIFIVIICLDTEQM